MSTMKYPVAIEPGSDATAWGVVVPDLPGCFSAGGSLVEAYENAREAIMAWLNAASDSQKSIPAASRLDDLAQRPEFDGWLWAMITVGAPGPVPAT